MMSQRAQPSDLELAALISSKICHDIINPVGAIYNGLEILDEEDDEEAKNYALDVIRNVTEQASARLQFARFAFGAAGSAGLDDRSWHGRADQPRLSRPGEAQARVARCARATWARTRSSCCSISWPPPSAHCRAVVRSRLSIRGSLDDPSFSVRCSGIGARAPLHLQEFIDGSHAAPLDTMTVQAYYTCRLAQTSRMRLAVLKDGGDIVLSARP